MATSGSKSVTVTSWDTLKFSWWINSQSTANNTTMIGWKMELIAGSDGRISSTASKSWSVTVNGTKYSGTNTVGISNNATKTLASGTTTITHNSDGTKTFSYSFSQQFSITFSGSTIGTKSGSGSGTLTTIPRKSSLTASNGTLGTAQTLTINKADSSFKHKITYKCGTASGYAAGSSSTFTTANSVSWTPPLSLASQNTTGTSVSITFTITTYTSGGTQIGTATKTISCSIPSSVKPSCTLAVTDPTGYFNTYGAYIKGLSKFKVVITPTTAYGSPIASYSTTANGTKYTSASFTTGVLKSSGNLTISVTVKDKRGRSGSDSETVSVLDYTAPAVSVINVRRCNEDGTENDKGEFAQVIFSADVTSLDGQNTAKYVLKYKKSTDSIYTTVELTEYNNAYSVADVSYIFAADSGNSYDVVLSVTDNFKTSNKTTSVSTGFTLMHWKANGRGMAIGKVSEIDDTLEIAMKMRSTYGHLMPTPMELIEGQDLDVLLDPGYYIIGNTTSSATILNKPPMLNTETALIEVIPMGDGIQKLQRFTVCDKDDQYTWQRLYYTSSWGEWMLVGGCSGWKSLTLDSAFTSYQDNTTPKYKVNGSLVTIKGAVTPKTAYASNTTKVPFASGIPEALRPDMAINFICQGSGMNRWACGVETDGTLTVSRYGITEGTTIEAGAWLIFNCTYSI